MPTETTTAPAVGGGSPNGESQAQPIEGQPSETSQQTAEPRVDGSETQTSSQDKGGGQKTSKFYAERERDRRTIRELNERIAKLESARTSPPSSQPVQPKIDPFWNEFIDKPQEVIRSTIEQMIGQTKAESARQEAEKLIVSNDAYKRDPETFIANMRMITQDPDLEYLDIWAAKNPVGATKKALEVYAERFGTRQPNPNAPKKGQMVNTATGSPGMTGGMNKEALIGELKKMQVDLADKPEIRKDPKFWEKYKSIKEQLVNVK